ncbi:Metallo-dependent phosphatase-like protein [Naematelia encephala]|uniref:Metallo-dependent phosphatase-like protein n=1 Tax=Naematelia encephala TaxID=71784 RepID=A0A1Y2BE31_9TREE|nr:Metallo-dependent phosphatase-like protein [Naematelia encephala]
MSDLESPPPQYDPVPSSQPTPGSPTHRQGFTDPYDQPSTIVPRPQLTSKNSIFDELLPVPSTTSIGLSSSSSTETGRPSYPVLRRIGALAVIVIFLSSITFLAGTTEDAKHTVGDAGLRKVFGVGSEAGVGGAGWVAQDLGDVQVTSTSSAVDAESTEDVKPKLDFEKYTMLHTIPPSSIDLTTPGRRTIFIGDVHGSYAPLLRLMDKLKYQTSHDFLIHVGDLIAKGEQNEEVLLWMNRHRVLGVRGNHDQPVIQWRNWMEWAGGENWQTYIDGLSSGPSEGMYRTLGRQGKMYPKGWEWNSEHWKIARTLKKQAYLYLLQLPLALHLPSLNTIVVHAGLLPHDPTKSISDSTQPLVAAAAAAETNSTNYNPSAGRLGEELSLLFDVAQNRDPWTLLNMRSVYTEGKKEGQVTKSSKKGTPWSEVWRDEMGRCEGEGSWYVAGMGEWTAEKEHDEDEGVESQEDGEADEMEDQAGDEVDTDTDTDDNKRKRDDDLKKIPCSPVTVIYGHAAGRGLDIKPFSKGLDTGCVYGKKLTALVLGDLSGLEGGETVRVGNHEGLLISEDCEKGGL